MDAKIQGFSVNMEIFEQGGWVDGSVFSREAIASARQ
jgi:hypothetical protein